MSTLDRVTLVALGGVLAYAAFQWGGVLRTDRYAFLLALGVLAIVLGLRRSRHEWAPHPGRVVRLATVLLPAYVLLQVVPLPVAMLRVLSPARAAAMDALGPIGAKLSYASLSVSPRTFQWAAPKCQYAWPRERATSRASTPSCGVRCWLRSDRRGQREQDRRSVCFLASAFWLVTPDSWLLASELGF